MHEIVHLLGADECVACIGSLGFETASQGEAVAIAQVHGAGQFYTSVQESGHTALAVTVFCKETVLHLAVAIHAGATHACGNVVVTYADSLGVCGIGIELLHHYVVVVGIAVALLHCTSGVLQVIVGPWVGFLIRAHKMTVNVVEVLAAEHVFQSLVVHTLGAAELDAGIEFAGLVYGPVEVASQRCGQMVVVAGLDPVDGIVAGLVQLLVGKVKFVKIDLTCLRTALPVFLGGIVGIPVIVAAVGLSPHIVVVGREVLPVVRSRVSSAVIQFGAAVQLVAHHGTGCQLHVVFNLVVPCQQCCGSIVIYYSAGSLLAVLVAPVGIVLAVVGEPICLVGTCTLLCALCGVAPCGQVQRVAVFPLLLYGKQV